MSGIDSEKAVTAAVAAVTKSKAAEGRKPEGGEGQAAIHQKPSSCKSPVFLPRRKDLGVQSMVIYRIEDVVYCAAARSLPNPNPCDK